MIDIKDKKLINVKFIDLFSGIGGFRLALESFGAECVFSSDWDKHAQETYKNNFGEKPHGDITLIDEKSIPNHDILCAGFPCQPFSISGKQNGFEDARGTLFFDIVRIVKEKQPKIVFLENVRNFENHDNGNTLRIVKSSMIKLGYTFFYKVLNSADYGVPQKRERIYMVCFRNDLNINEFKFPKKIELTKYVEDILVSDKVAEKLYLNRNDIQLNDKIKPNNPKNPIRLGQVRNGGQGERIYSTKGTAITLSANGGGVFSKTGGYLVNNRVRKLHVRECARIMGFPESFQISVSDAQAYKQFGNSVVVDVLQYIMIEVNKYVKWSDDYEKP